MDWHLSYLAGASPSLDELSSALSSVTGPLDRAISEWNGDPRDGYIRSITLSAKLAGGMTLSARITHQTLDTVDPLPADTARLNVSLSGEDTRAMLSTWESLSGALSALGYEDTTLADGPAPIVDALERVGERDRARAMRREITEALVGRVARYRHVALGATRPDDFDAVLRAYERPEGIVSVSFSGCGLTEIPREVRRFVNVRTFGLHDERLDLSALRGFAFAALEELAMTGTDVVRVEPDDLRPFSRLHTVFLSGSRVESVSEAVLEARPTLRRFALYDTPLARDEASFTRLQRAWPGVRVER
jgi:hypothetical protein